MFLKLKTNNQGSILLEAILSTVILAVCITLIIQSMFASLKATHYSSDYTVGLIHADNIMNHLRYKKEIEAGKREEGEIASLGDKYKYLIITKEFVDKNVEGINHVGMDVWWESGNRANKILFETYLSQKKDLEDKDDDG